MTYEEKILQRAEEFASDKYYRDESQGSFDDFEGKENWIAVYKEIAKFSLQKEAEAYRTALEDFLHYSQWDTEENEIREANIETTLRSYGLIP